MPSKHYHKYLQHGQKSMHQPHDGQLADAMMPVRVQSLVLHGCTAAPHIPSPRTSQHTSKPQSRVGTSTDYQLIICTAVGA